MLKTSRPLSVSTLGSLSLSLGLLAVLASTGCNSYKKTGVEAVRTNKGDIDACVSELKNRTPGAQGEMGLKFEIAPNGKVNRFIFSKDEVKDPAFTECVKQRAIQWQLPAPPSGKMEVFEYGFKVKS